MGNPVLKNIVDTLTWFEAMGVDEVINDVPANQFALHAEKAKQKQVTQQLSQPSPQAASYMPVKSKQTTALASPESAVVATRQIADEVKDLASLRSAVEGYSGLSICKTATNTVFADGNSDADIMLIGEAPGADEDLQGIPFCGASGKLLEQMLNCIGLYRDKNYYISNTVFWRPPGNRKPTPQELAACLPFVEKHIALVQPKVIILVGGTAIASLLESKKGITSMRGKFLEYSNRYMEKPIPVTPIFHPSYLLRSPGQKRLAWKDLLTIDAFIEEYGLSK